jgi:predicted peroxiredoxin
VGWPGRSAGSREPGWPEPGTFRPREKIGQLQTLGGHVYVCGPSMQHFKVATTDLAVDGVAVAEYLTFMMPAPTTRCGRVGYRNG